MRISFLQKTIAACTVCLALLVSAVAAPAPIDYIPADADAVFVLDTNKLLAIPMLRPLIPLIDGALQQNSLSLNDLKGRSAGGVEILNFNESRIRISGVAETADVTKLMALLKKDPDMKKMGKEITVSGKPGILIQDPEPGKTVSISLLQLASNRVQTIMTLNAGNVQYLLADGQKNLMVRRSAEFNLGNAVFAAVADLRKIIDKAGSEFAQDPESRKYLDALQLLAISIEPGTADSVLFKAQLACSDAAIAQEIKNKCQETYTALIADPGAPAAAKKLRFACSGKNVVFSIELTQQDIMELVGTAMGTDSSTSVTVKPE